MRRLIATIFMMSGVVFGFGQFSGFTGFPHPISKSNLPDKIKTIREYENDLLSSEWIFDTLRNEIFYRSISPFSFRRNDNNLILVKGYIYDNSCKVVKSFGLHSNVGLSINYYEYDSIGNCVKQYRQDNKYEYDDSMANKNPYSYISEIKSLDDILNHPKIKEIEMIAEKYLLYETAFDSIGNIVTVFTFNEQGYTTNFSRNEYDKDNDKIYSYSGLSNDSYTENYYEYEKEYSFFENEEGIPPKFEKSNLVINLRLDYNPKEKRKRISYIAVDKYDRKDRLIERVFIDRGKIQSKSIYEYNNFNQITKKTTFELDKATSEEINKYDNKGNILEKTYNNIRFGEKKVFKYQYEYYE